MIRHRPSLLRYHKRHLRLGESQTAPPGSPLASTINLKALNTRAPGWQLTELESTTDQEQLELDTEIDKLEGLLAGVGAWEDRLRSVNAQLSASK